MAREFTSAYFDDPFVMGRIADFFAPLMPSRDIAIFFVHGGGWRGGARSVFHNIIRAFNAEGFFCATTDYRLAGVSIRDQITDVRHGYDLFVSYLKDAGRPARIVVIGSSAGAHLAALLALTNPGDCGEAPDFGGFVPCNDWTPPLAAALQSAPLTFEPWEDIFPAIWDSMQDIVGVPWREQPELYRAVSPVLHISPSAPPFFLLEAANEHMFPIEIAQNFIGRLHSLGRRAELKVYARAEHGFFYDLVRRVQREAFADVLGFIESLG